MKRLLFYLLLLTTTITSAQVQNELWLKPHTASGTDTYTVTISGAGYNTGRTYKVKFTNANTGASTININSLGAKSIKKNATEDLASGDIKAGGEYLLSYDGTNFQLIGGASTTGIGLIDGDKVDITVTGSGATWTIDNNTISTAKLQNLSVTDSKINDVSWNKVTNVLYSSASGTNTYTATIANLPTYVAGQYIIIRFTNGNTGASTLNINSLGAISIKKNVNENLVQGDIVAGSVHLLAYDGTNFQLAEKYNDQILFAEEVGAIPDGVTDNYSILQTIINNNVGREIRIGKNPSHVFIISRQLSLPTNSKIKIDGTIKLKNADIRPILTTITNGSTTVDVTNAGTYFVVGERICVSDDNQPVNGGGSWKTRKVGMTNVIQSISGNTITFTTAFTGILGSGSITSAANGKIANAEGAILVDGATNVSITGSGFIDGNLANRYNVAGAIPGGGLEDLKSNIGITLNNCSDVFIQGINGKLNIKNFVMHGISTSYQTVAGIKSERVVIDNVKFDGSVDKAVAGLLLVNSRITNCENINGIDEGEIILYNGCQNVLIQNILSYGNRRYGVAITGQDNYNITIDNCFSIISRNKPSTYAFYIQNQLYGTSISNITASHEQMESTWSRVTTTATVTTPVDHNLTNGQSVYVGVSNSVSAIPLGYYTITVTSATTFTFTCLNAGLTNGTLSYVGMATSGSVVLNSSRNVDIKNVTIYNSKGTASPAISIDANTAYATTSTDIKIDGINIKDFYTGSIATAAFGFKNCNRVFVSNFNVDGASRFVNDISGNTLIEFNTGSIQNTTSLFVTNNNKVLFKNVKGDYVFETSATETIPIGTTEYFVNHGLSIAPRIQDIKITPLSDGLLDDNLVIIPSSLNTNNFKIKRNNSAATGVFRWEVVTNQANDLGTKTYSNNYTSNFSAGVDGWTATRSVLTGNQDGITDGTTSFDDCILMYADNSNNTHEASKTIAVNAKANKIRCYYYIPSGQTNVNGFAFFANTFAVTAIDLRFSNAVVGTWTEISSADFVANTTTIIIRMYKAGGVSTFVGANVSTDDRIYFKFILDDYIP